MKMQERTGNIDKPDIIQDPWLQIKQNEDRISALTAAQSDLKKKNRLLEQQCAGLKEANEKLTAYNTEHDKLTGELSSAYKRLKKTDDYLKEYVKGLEEMMHITSHKVRQPVANILGITGIIRSYINSPRQLKKLVKYLETSAVSLDLFTKELTDFVFVLEQKSKIQDYDVSAI